MNKVILFLLLSAVSIEEALATGQSSELIIFKGDTLQMLTEPLELFFRDHEPREEHYPSLEIGCSTALWRGYVGLWKIEDSKLFLIDIFSCGNKNSSILREIFPAKGPILADWFNGNLNIQHGKTILYNHSAYDRYYEEETVVEIINGKEQSQKHYINGIRPSDKGYVNNVDSVRSEIYERLEWTDLPSLSNDKKLYIQLTT